MMHLNETEKNQVITQIEKHIQDHSVFLYMKGTPDFPQCGFSSQVVHILKALGVKFESCNILENPSIRAVLPQYAKWPTFPQLYVQGTLVGGCDIVTEMYEGKELEKLLTEEIKK